MSATHTPSIDARVWDLELDLDELRTLMELIEWEDVPTISVREGAAWEARLQEAHETVREQVPAETQEGEANDA